MPADVSKRRQYASNSQANVCKVFGSIKDTQGFAQSSNNSCCKESLAVLRTRKDARGFAQGVAALKFCGRGFNFLAKSQGLLA